MVECQTKVEQGIKHAKEEKRTEQDQLVHEIRKS